MAVMGVQVRLFKESRFVYESSEVERLPTGRKHIIKTFFRGVKKITDQGW